MKLKKFPSLFSNFDQKYYAVLAVLLKSSSKDQNQVKQSLKEIISMLQTPDNCERIRSSLEKIVFELYHLQYFDGILDLILSLCHTLNPTNSDRKTVDNVNRVRTSFLTSSYLFIIIININVLY